MSLYQRLQSFKNWPSHFGVSKEDLASQGFIYDTCVISENIECVRCVFCHVHISIWSMDKEDVKLRHRQLCPVCPFVFDWVMNTEEEVKLKLSQRRFSPACPFDNESFGRYLQNEFSKLYQKANNGIAKTESNNQRCSTKSVDILQTKDNQNDDEYDDYSDFDDLLTAKIEKTCTRTRPNSYKKQTEKQRKKAEQRRLQRQLSKRKTKIRNANRDQKQTYCQEKNDDDNYTTQTVSNDRDVKIHDRKMCWVCRSRDIDDMIEDQFLQSYERFLEEKYKEEFDNCFADEIGGVDDEEQNQIERVPYVLSPYEYLIDKKVEEEAHHIYFSDYEAFDEAYDRLLINEPKDIYHQYVAQGWI
ncbi:hypothetical protein DPMN_089768 [Dreissena polymorpha]|uniref:RING-type domain-containing protein n=1 Tax=Dreissena polymorpha TaxID=45954 RepID=A0A9D4IIT2_DREPO|nr:hypothetical protein DPMN_176035 [Dreissena polymorpha]KAH3798309.1 hypothetical protein DPMN_151907 [Dreissena polymorpha]KAH3847447.1 hypothetical protein DPMN_089768 [Dreissena polymorpha]